MKVAIDFDDTCVQFTAAWVIAYNHLFAERPAIPTLEVDRWKLTEVGKLTQDELEQTFEYIRAQNYNLMMHPTDKSMEHWINKLRKDGHEVFCLTSNPEKMKSKIQKWFQYYGIPDMEVICTESTKDKLKHNFSVLVDDNPELIELMEKDSRSLITYWCLHNKPYNHKAKRTAANWESVYNQITEIAAINKAHEALKNNIETRY